jgi:hypothetical protein
MMILGQRLQMTNVEPEVLEFHADLPRSCVWNVPPQSLLSFEMTVVVDPPSPLEYHMSNRRPATVSKHARGPKIAARAQRTKQAIVRSTKDPLRAVEESTEPTDSKQEAPLVENRMTASQDDFSQMMRGIDSKKTFGFSLATAKVQAYQGKLLEMAQANVQFSFEFAGRLATIG